VIDQVTIDSLREKYHKVHFLLFQRSVERARSAGDLFDILDTIPEKYPVIWDDREHRWVHTDDILQTEQFRPQLEDSTTQ
jgi:hypothetical protein